MYNYKQKKYSQNIFNKLWGIIKIFLGKVKRYFVVNNGFLPWDSFKAPILMLNHEPLMEKNEACSAYLILSSLSFYTRQ